VESKSDDWFEAEEAPENVAPEEFEELSAFEENERPAPEY
jgi:hypothetical protein